MSEKLSCEITEIELNPVVFMADNKPVYPTYVNFFFGNNGTGKTTIARAIKKGIGISYAAGKTKDDYLPLVFDQDYINANIQSYHSLPGVFTINEVNANIQKQIDGKIAEQNDARKRIAVAVKEQEKREKEKSHADNDFYAACWNKTEKDRYRFNHTQSGLKSSKKKFAETLRSYSPVAHDADKLKRTYDSLYSSDSKAYPPFNVIDDVSALDNLSDMELLSLAIVNTANTPFAQFMKDIGSIEWVQEGHSEYHAKTDGKCPYCSQPLPKDFEEFFAASFDKQYQINMQKLSSFQKSYRAKADEILSLLSIPTEVYPAIDVKLYNDKVAATKGIIAENIGKISEKISKPSDIMSLAPIAPTLQELADIIKEFNELITANNALVKEKDAKKAECKKQVFEYLAFIVQDTAKAHEKQSASIIKEINKQKALIDKDKKLIKNLKDELRSLNSQTVETESAMNNINALLKDSGFQGFEIRPKREEVVRPDGVTETFLPTLARNYEVIRPDTGEVAENLSEGEKNFLAFLYFQQTVFGSKSEEADMREKIVVIDDPVSSMDSGTLFMVGTQVRKMIEVCRNNANNRNPEVTGNFIKQIFILTHNAYFHREISYSYVNNYEFVSFYLVKKRDKKSSVDLCEAQNPKSPSDMMNVNPVKNSYAALWDEYKEVDSGTPLMNVARRILEYYFLQLCGYEGKDLRQRILEKNKDAFTHNENGEEDYTKFDLASAMLSYMTVNSTVVNDGLHYVDGCIDSAQCRATFQMIFKYMEQEQHYNMMMGIN
ncbi:MAG: AAA family ATPase [Selenomonadaceae bacterium]|nr:AAA family ATPase [Selenomonadaceae bacterium]